MEAIEEEIVSLEIDDETYEEIDDVHKATVNGRVRRSGNKREDEDMGIMDISRVVSFFKGKNVIAIAICWRVLTKSQSPVATYLITIHLSNFF